MRTYFLSELLGDIFLQLSTYEPGRTDSLTMP